jgi:predicted MFS family arabinose efflux permease
LFQAANRLTILVGPPLAGVLIAVIGASNVLYVDAASYLVSFLLLLVFVHPPEVPVQEDERGVLAGVRFLFSDRLLRVWTPALTLLDVCWTLFFASLPVLVVTKYGADPHILGWLFGALGGGALVGALVALRIVRRVAPLALTAVAFLCQMAAMWGVAVPAHWGVPLVAIAVGGFFMSLVNAPLHALLMLRMPRHLRAQSLAASGVFTSVAAPLGLVIAGWALTRYDTRAVLATVLTVQTAAVLTIVVAALAERATLRSATAVDSPA